MEKGHGREVRGTGRSWGRIRRLRFITNLQRAALGERQVASLSAEHLLLDTLHYVLLQVLVSDSSSSTGGGLCGTQAAEQYQPETRTSHQSHRRN